MKVFFLHPVNQPACTRLLSVVNIPITCAYFRACHLVTCMGYVTRRYEQVLKRLTQKRWLLRYVLYQV